jgi:hypothetical protein
MRVTDQDIQGVRLKTEPRRKAHLTALIYAPPHVTVRIRNDLQL